MKKSFLLTTIILVLLAIQLINGQTTHTAAETSWPLEVREFQASIVNVVKVQSPTNMSMPNSGGMGMGTMTPTSSSREQELQFALKTKNTTGKTITALLWEARFINAEQRIVSQQFKSKKKIKPGKDEDIEEVMNFDTALLPVTVKIGFRIMKVEYSDHSAWENCMKEHDTCFVYKTINFAQH
jgi:hypothetical protein